MAGDSLSIGDVAERTGLSVRTVRFYADRGVVPERGRGPSGYREFAPDAVARLRLVRTLRDLGVPLDAVRRVLARQADVADVAAAHAGAVEAQIRALRLQRAVLLAIAEDTDPEEAERMHDLAALSKRERDAIVKDYLDAVFAGARGDDAVLAKHRMGAPELPDDPTPAQLEAWVELVGLMRDPAFRAAARAMAERAAAEPEPPGASVALGKAIGEHAGPAVAAGADPASPEAAELLLRIEAQAGDAAADRATRAARIEAFTDRRVGRYWALVGVVNGWPPQPDRIPEWEWYAAALRAHA